MGKLPAASFAELNRTGLRNVNCVSFSHKDDQIQAAIRSADPNQSGSDRESASLKGVPVPDGMVLFSEAQTQIGVKH